MADGGGAARRHFSTIDETVEIGERTKAIGQDPQSFGSGRYQVRCLLGEGGQKRVFLAWDTRLERDVVVALLRTANLGEDAITRLRREARAMAQLGDHPNIVAVYDIGEEDGRPYLVCQYISGGSLRDVCRGCHSGKLPLEKVVRLGRQVSLALDYAHTRGIVHRDLKPANIWLTPDGTAKLGDFGLALPLADTRLTESGMLMGTVLYMSPEQARGQAPTARGDLYSLGVVLYEMVTGRPPFQGDNAAGILWQHVNEPPVAPSFFNPEIPPEMQALILDLLAKDPEKRPARGAVVAERLENLTSSRVAAGGAAIVEPTSIARLAGGVFVGRERQLAQLQQGLRDAFAGAGSIRLVAGDPGLGKTRITEQVSAYARLRQTRVFVGQCVEGEGCPAFWPWFQIIRDFAQTADSGLLRQALGSGAGAIATLAPEIAERISTIVVPPALEPAQARFRLFDSITTFLKNAAAQRPLLLVLEDLHWADQASLRLLEFVAREVSDSRLLVVATYRNQGLDARHPLTQTVAELARYGTVERVELGPLTEDDVARYLELTAGAPPAESLVRVVYERTEGNPFFLSQLVKLLVTEGVLDDTARAAALARQLPNEVRHVILRRVAQLSTESARVLSVGSVLGREFKLEEVVALADRSKDEILELLEEPLAARVIEESGVFGRFYFTHALIRETLYNEIGASRRSRLHQRAAEFLEQNGGGNLLLLLTEIAHHRFRSGTPADTGKAIEYSAKAAQEAIRILAYEEAAGHYERALQALPHAHAAGPFDRCDLLLALGEAQKRAGKSEAARDAFECAADLARQTGAIEKLAMAALGIGVPITGAFGGIDQIQIELLKEALEKLPPEDSALRAKLLAQLSSALYYFTDQRVTLSREAVEMARRINEPGAIQLSLYCRHVALMLTERLEDRTAVSAELLRLSELSGNKEIQLRARYRRIIDLTETGDITSLDEELDAYVKLAEELRQPAYLWMARHFRGARAFFNGRFEEATGLVEEALALGRKAEDPMAVLFGSVVMNGVYVESGTPEKLLEPMHRQIEKYPMIPGNRAVLAYVYCHMGQFREAAAQVDLVAARNFQDLPRDGSLITVIAGLAWTCNRLRDAARTAMLYPMVEAYPRRVIMSGNSAVAWGWISRPLGLLASTLGRWDEAAAHYEEAIRMNAQMGARPFEAGSRLEYARVLASRNSPGDREYALANLDVAAQIAADIGARKISVDILELRTRMEAAGDSGEAGLRGII